MNQPAQPTIASLLASARAVLGGDQARADSEALLGFVLDRNRAYLYAWPEAPVDPLASARFHALLARREAGESLAHLTGRREFWSLSLRVTPATLDPRPETELLVECALELVDAPRAEVLDLGTRTGAIALALASERPGWRMTGVDIDPDAVAVAYANTGSLGFVNVRLLAGDWYAPLAMHRFALIVANPPYIRADDPCLDGPGVRFEPRRALVAGADGLDALRCVIGGAPLHLADGGALACEHGAAQGEAVRALLAQAGFARIFTRRDLGGRERVSGGRLVV